MKIYKYPIPIIDKFVIEMPLDSKILSFQMQNELPMIWAAIWENSLTEERKFSIRGTGHDIDMDFVKQYIGTVQQFSGNLVWHLFEMK